MRKLASIKTINEIRSIPDADKICAYRVDGWWVVDTVGKFQCGDMVVYLEVDAWVPNSIAPFLSKGQEPREYEGIKGERLRTVKLRGQISQGLLLPVADRFDDSVLVGSCPYLFKEGDDVSEVLDIIKWEAPIPANLSGEVRGNFPEFIPKTDQERVQNLTRELTTWCESDTVWEVTEKLDGSSMTVYVFDDDSGVCSRNLNLKENEANSLWAVAKKYMMIEAIKSTGRNLALQGEIIGEGIQGNPYKLKGQDFYLFDIFDIDTGTYLPPDERRTYADMLGLNHVPVISEVQTIIGDIEALLTSAEDKSVLCSTTEREGLVFKNVNTPEESFKVISNKFLIKTKN